MGNKKYSGSIALTKLKCVKMKAKSKGKEIEGLFIPIDENFLVRGKMTDEGQPVYLPIETIVRENVDDYGQIGFMAQKGNKKWSECTDEEKEIFKTLPILGNIKDWSQGNAAAADTGGQAGGNQVFNPDDDLPF